MRIERLNLIRYGMFTDVSLDLASHHGGFHLLYGPNESGKSTTRRAIHGLLFGIHQNTQDAHLHAPKDLRIGARITGSEGTDREVVRRKGRKATLLDPEGDPLPDDPVAALLGGIEGNQYATMFSLDHERLVRGGQELAQGKGDLGETLFGAGIGGKGVHSLLQELRNRAEALFKPNASKPHLNKALKAYHDCQKAAREAAVRPRDWREAERREQEARAAYDAARRSYQERSAEKQRLERLRRTIPWIQALHRAQATLQDLADVPVLDEDAREQRQAAESRESNAETALEEIQQKLVELETHLTNLTVPQGVLARAEDIERLYAEVAAYRQDLSNQADAAQAGAHHEGRLRSCLRELGRSDLSIEELDALWVPKNVRTRVQELARQFSGLRQASEQAAQDRQDQEATRAQLEKRLQELGEPGDFRDLDDALRKAWESGDLAAQARDQQGILEQAQEAAQQALGRLGRFNGTWDEALSLPVPVTETVDRFDQALTEQDQNIAGLERELEGNRAHQGDKAASIRAMEAAGSVPTMDQLAAARHDRDKLWETIRRQWVDGEPGTEPAEKVAEAFKGKTAAADELADRLRREADRVAQYAQLQQDLKGLEKAQERLETQVAQARTRREALWEEWRTAWTEAGLEPDSPLEMRAWLDRLREAQEAIRDARVEQDRLNKLERTMEAQRDALHRALAHLGHSVETQDFEGVRRQAERCLSDLQETARQRAQTQKELGEAQARVRAAQRRAEQAHSELEEWQANWQRELARLSLPPEATTEQAQEQLELLDQLQQEHTELSKARETERQSRARAERFAWEVRGLVEAVAPVLRASEPDQAIQGLFERLREGRNQKKLQEQYQQNYEEKERERERAENELREVRKILNRLMEAAGAPDRATLRQIEEEDIRRREAHQDLNQAREQLMREPLPLEGLEAEAEGVDYDALPGRIQSTEADLDPLQQAIDARWADYEAARREREQIDGGAEAYRHQIEAEEALADLVYYGRQYARTQLAVRLLEKEIESYRQAHEGPILERAGALFQRITLGSFEGLDTEFDEGDELVLRGRRPDGSLVPLAGLTDGTEDQLYLALRLASLEEQLTQREPLPLVMDDLLINFDDARARATLEVLGELSELTQILFFTHHDHLRELAQATLPESRAAIHELSPHAPVIALGEIDSGNP